MGASMANITRIKAKETSASEKTKEVEASDAEIIRKVSVKAKNSSNKKLEKAKKAEQKAKKSEKKETVKEESAEEPKEEKKKTFGEIRFFGKKN